MPLSTMDRQLLDSMRQRELNLKKRQRAASAIHHELGRYRRVLRVGTALILATGVAAVCLVTGTAYLDGSELWKETLIVFATAALFGWLLAAGTLHTEVGRVLLARKEARLYEKYNGELNAGRRWQQFYYRGEDISAYVGQILYFVESEQRFDSVDEALAFVKEHGRENPFFKARGRELFDRVAAQTNLLVLSSTDEDGAPSSRFMRFVRSDRPGVWYVTTAPDAPKVHELEQPFLALVTAPTASGATISSNRVRVRRADVGFPAIAGLYRAQAPRYLDGMTEEDQRRELVYELTLESAKVSDWVEQELVEFDA
jgi:hypothetical protein